MSEFWSDPELKKNFENVFNKTTLKSLYDLSDKGFFDVLHGAVKDGKESKIFVAEDSDGEKLAVKIYTIEASNYDEMTKYLFNDPRFEGISDKKRDIIFAWCKKEFKNLKKANRIGLNAPNPVAFNRNVLMMDFIGEGFKPAPKLNEVRLEEPEREFKFLIDQLKKLYAEENLVHGDMSPYNILWHRKPYLIDFSQAVLSSHPLADDLLERDLKNLVEHFNKEYSLSKDLKEVISFVRSEKD
ncbi:MAG: serine protein kinase RIO [Candidatus Nanohaloarchaeota archaeon QJJ-9]|nr:serine protein kinase RIO [Candidatus Nanohaloarchaeota archaeon QJJ-9]